MIWNRLMAAFCKAVGHALEYDDGHWYCVRCAAAFGSNTAAATTQRWPK